MLSITRLYYDYGATTHTEFRLLGDMNVPRPTLYVCNYGLNKAEFYFKQWVLVPC